MVLTDELHARWRRDGWLVLRDVVPGPVVASVVDAVDEVTSWAGQGDAPGLHHWEQTDDGPALARSEDLVDDHAGLEGFVCDGLLPSIAGELLGEAAVLFKEKINHKHPGGAGFAPHQDATAYRFVDHHVSCMVPVDPATAANGCLSVASGQHHGLLPTTPGGRIDPGVAAGLEWELAELAPGDLLWFDSYTPHRSDTNRSDRPRRALYLTYNGAAVGDLRDAYYADKRAELSALGDTFDDGRVRLSITDDFLGRPVRRVPSP